VSSGEYTLADIAHAGNSTVYEYWPRAVRLPCTSTLTLGAG
jgi:hypothetical protein